MTQKIGFVGLGAMGLPMATNLLAAGYHLTVYNRTASKAEPLIAKGARRAERAGDVAHPGGIVVSMLADDASVKALVTGEDALAERIAPDGIHVSMSTVSPAITRELAAYHEMRGSVMVAAPVFGRPSSAQAKWLWVCTSGSSDAKAKVKPILEAMGQDIFDFGDNPGAANVVKLAGNFMIAAALEAMGEAVAMMRKSGVDPAAALEMLAKTLFAAPVYQGYGPAIAHGRFTPAGFRLPLGLKDIDLVLQTAAAANAPMPAASLLRDRFISAIAKGRADLDWSAIALGAADDAGLKESR
ncbi:MAG: NAD(P)-dependent oxidoreductase [Candidatus Binatus sp.]|jgi:3-hydroxyisobutyrate dehydrogenase-like beta-hydroxyacid dehydrogenase|uniref:NAD(P)-dependent oxidoreductase n=1 Tax=Candidatus Binatus sp. TaxID=2811406 RepID=UPI003D0F945F